MHPFALEALLEAYGPLPECLVQALEALLDPSLDKAGDERFTRREWTVAAGEQTIEVKESLFEGEPYFISLAGQFFLDPLRETSAKPLCLTLEMGWVTDPVVLFTCDPETVEQLARVIRTRSFVKQNASARLHRTATGELAPLFRIGGVGSGCTHCLRLTFEDAYVFKSDVSRSADGTGSLDFGYNDAILGMLEKIAREQGMTLRW